jgi:hypothetical protein
VEHRRRRSCALRFLGASDPPTAECPDDAELAQFLDRRLEAARARLLEAHFDRCHECRELAFALAELDPEKI